MRHLGDITKIDGRSAPIVDVIIGGSPCQDLSVAGKRAGLQGERSGLFMEQIRIIKEMRQQSEICADEFIRPRYFVWENVPGAFSSNGGEDFRVVLEEICRIKDKNAVVSRLSRGGKWSSSGCILGDGWSVAWRVLDAQFWGVPQRRRRIALVADFGGQSAPEILFVRESLSWCASESGGERKGASEASQRDLGTAIGFNYLMGSKARSVGAEVERSETLRAGSTGMAVCYDMTHADDVIRECGEKSPTLQSRMGTGGNQVPICLGVDTYNQCQTGDKAKSLIARHSDADGVPCVVTGEEMAFHLTQDPIAGDKSPCLSSGNPVNGQASVGVVFAIDRAAFNQGENAQFDPNINEDDISQTLVSKGPGAVCYAVGNGQVQQTGLHNVVGALNCMHDQQAVMNKYGVRRLTPLECERLQGFPDGWTDIGDWVDSKGKKHNANDSARYKALGNSIAIPPWRWVLKRLCGCYEREATMASLFDGIGGFPMIWEQLNGRGSCLWASEIEEFPIAVTTAHFGNEEK